MKWKNELFLYPREDNSRIIEQHRLIAVHFVPMFVKLLTVWR